MTQPNWQIELDKQQGKQVNAAMDYSANSRAMPTFSMDPVSPPPLSYGASSASSWHSSDTTAFSGVQSPTYQAEHYGGAPGRAYAHHVFYVAPPTTWEKCVGLFQFLFMSVPGLLIVAILGYFWYVGHNLPAAKARTAQTPPPDQAALVVAEQTAPPSSDDDRCKNGDRRYAMFRLVCGRHPARVAAAQSR